jgi:hypothetical protein
MTTGGFPRGGNSPADAASCYCFPSWPENIPCPAPFPATRHLYQQALPAAMSTHQSRSKGESTTPKPTLAMPHRKIAN